MSEDWFPGLVTACRAGIYHGNFVRDQATVYGVCPIGKGNLRFFKILTKFQCRISTLGGYLVSPSEVVFKTNNIVFAQVVAGLNFDDLERIDR